MHRHSSNMDPSGSPDPLHLAPTRVECETRPDSETQLDRLADRLRIVAWSDPLVDQLGHDPRSTYAERFWLPVLGPPSVAI